MELHHHADGAELTNEIGYFRARPEGSSDLARWKASRISPCECSSAGRFSDASSGLRLPWRRAPYVIRIAVTSPNTVKTPRATAVVRARDIIRARARALLRRFIQGFIPRAQEEQAVKHLIACNHGTPQRRLLPLRGPHRAPVE